MDSGRDSVYVCGLPAGISHDVFHELVARHGTPTSVRIVPEKKHGFAKFGSEDEAQAVVEQLNGFSHQGSKLFAWLVKGEGSQSASGSGIQSSSVGGTSIASARGSTSGTGGVSERNQQTGANMSRREQSSSNSIHTGMDSTASEDPPPSDRLYIKGLPVGMTEDSLCDVFMPYGALVSWEILDPAASTADGVGESIGLVQMGSVEEAMWVIENLDGNVPEGLTAPIGVKFAMPQALKPGLQVTQRPKQSMSTVLAPPPPPPKALMTGHPEPEQIDQIYVRGLPPGMTEAELRELFDGYGEVVWCRVLDAKGTQSIALVQFASADEATWTVENLNGNIPEGYEAPITVKYAESKKRKSEQRSTMEVTPEPPPPIHPATPKPPIRPATPKPPGAIKANGTVSAPSRPLVRKPPVVRPPPAVRPKPQPAAQPSPPPKQPQPKPAKVLKAATNDSVYVKELPPHMTNEDVKELFLGYGDVTWTRVLESQGFSEDGKGQSVALVQMATIDEAVWLVENLDGNIPEGLDRPVSVKFSTAKDWKSAPSTAKAWMTGPVAPNERKTAPAAKQSAAGQRKRGKARNAAATRKRRYQDA